MARPRGTDSAKLITVIKTESLIGEGTEKDPCRTVIQYWSINGELLSEKDGWEKRNLIERMADGSFRES